jgi:hypothetical protein
MQPIPLILRTTSDPVTQVFRTTSSEHCSPASSLPPILRTTSVPLANSNSICPAQLHPASHAEPVEGNSNRTRRPIQKIMAPHVGSEVSSVESSGVSRGLDEGSDAPVGAIGIMSAPLKGAIRMREKLSEYHADGSAWPLTACVLDPVSVFLSSTLVAKIAGSTATRMVPYVCSVGWLIEFVH